MQRMFLLFLPQLHFSARLLELLIQNIAILLSSPDNLSSFDALVEIAVSSKEHKRLIF